MKRRLLQGLACHPPPHARCARWINFNALVRRNLLTPLIGLASGITLSASIRSSYVLIFSLAALAVGLLIFSAIRKYCWLLQLGSALLFMTGGWFLASHTLAVTENTSNLLTWANGEKSYVLGKVDSPCEMDRESIRLVLRVLAIRQGDQTTPSPSSPEPAWARSKLAEFAESDGRLLLKVGEGDCRWRKGDLVQTYTKISRPERFKNHFSFDYPFYLLTRGMTATSFVENSDSVVRIHEGHSRWVQWISSLREQVTGTLQRVLFRRHPPAVLGPLPVDLRSGGGAPVAEPPAPRDQLDPGDEIQILSALLLGDKKSLSVETEKIFRKTGTTHLLVVSGLHLVMVGGIFYGLIRFFLSLWPPLLLRLSAKKWALLGSILPVVAYAALVGFSPSALRATLTLLLLGILIFLMREKEPLNLLIFVAAILLLFYPLMLFDLSFQLSFLSVFSILVLVPRWEDFLKKRFVTLKQRPFLRHFLQIVLTSVAVQLGIFPLLVNRFHQVSLVGVIANLFLVPFFTLGVMPLGLLGMIFSWLAPSIALPLFSLDASLLKGALLFLRWLASFSWSAPYLSGFAWPQILVFYLIFLLFFLRFRSRLKIILIGIALLLNFGIFRWQVWADRFDSSFRLSFLDVGQGDSLLLELPYGKKILVDAGGLPYGSFDMGEKVLLPSLFLRGISKIDVAVITHPHPDHYGGMIKVLEAFGPEEIWWNGQTSEHPSFQNLLAEAKERGISLKIFNHSTPPFYLQGVRFEVLHPSSNTPLPPRTDSTEINNNSLVIRLEDRNFSLLLPGDIQKETEELLLNSQKLSPAIFLKVPHHGSKTSSTEGFLDGVQPALAVIGVGKENRYHFPHASVLSLYEARKTRVFRTDEEGEIDLKWNGKELRVETFTGKKWRWSPPSPSPVASSPGDICGERSCAP